MVADATGSTATLFTIATPTSTAVSGVLLLSLAATVACVVMARRQGDPLPVIGPVLLPVAAPVGLAALAQAPSAASPTAVKHGAFPRAAK